MPIRHPKRSITRDIRTRRPLHPGREGDELEALQWPEVGIRVKDCMSRSAATIHSDALVRGAVEMMKGRRIRHLPVVDGDRVVGIITETDVLRVFHDVLGKGVLSRPYRWAFAYR